MPQPNATKGVLLSGERIVLAENPLPEVQKDPKIGTKLTAALKKGLKLHGFRSGGGLRVFRLESRSGTLKAYGEHPNAQEALALLAQDLTMYGRAYKAIYGTLYPHYLTGSCSPDGALDHWILQGNSIDAHWESDHVVVVLEGWGEYRVPREIWAETHKDISKRIQHTERGYIYETNGGSTRVLFSPEGKTEHRAWIWQTRQTGVAQTFDAALDLAFKAIPLERKDTP